MAPPHQTLCCPHMRLWSHGLLRGSGAVELNSSAGVCNSGMNALKFGYLSVKAGNSSNAVCTGSERVSTWLRANKYENEIQTLALLEEHPILAFKKDFLRFMLSDGAGAFLLENTPSSLTRFLTNHVDGGILLCPSVGSLYVCWRRKTIRWLSKSLE